ncbi:dissimilatory sulfite reductase D family protein [Chloroflexota bacterium]
MSGDITEELKDQIVEFFKKKGKMMTYRDVAKGVSISTRLAKKALIELVNAGTLEFTSYGGATFIKIPDE